MAKPEPCPFPAPKLAEFWEELRSQEGLKLPFHVVVEAAQGVTMVGLYRGLAAGKPDYVIVVQTPDASRATPRSWGWRARGWSNVPEGAFR
jgi:hypothetical protein